MSEMLSAIYIEHNNTKYYWTGSIWTKRFTDRRIYKASRVNASVSKLRNNWEYKTSFNSPPIKVVHWTE